EEQEKVVMHEKFWRATEPFSAHGVALEGPTRIVWNLAPSRPTQQLQQKIVTARQRLKPRN
ncbi:MAG TPA: hypothetical protein VIE87_03530, partial [Pseudolabrys sp.]